MSGFDFKKYVKNLSESYQKQVFNKRKFENDLREISKRNENKREKKTIKESDWGGRDNYQWAIDSNRWKKASEIIQDRNMHSWQSLMMLLDKPEEALGLALMARKAGWNEGADLCSARGMELTSHDRNSFEIDEFAENDTRMPGLSGMYGEEGLDEFNPMDDSFDSEEEDLMDFDDKDVNDYMVDDDDYVDDFDDDSLFDGGRKRPRFNPNEF